MKKIIRKHKGVFGTIKLNKRKSMICRYESNYVMPKLETLMSMFIIFNTLLDYLVGIDEKKSITIQDLTPEQENILDTILLEIRSKKQFPPKGLTQRQQNIFNDLLVEFNNS